MIRYIDMFRDRFGGRADLSHPGCGSVWVHHRSVLSGGEDKTGVGPCRA